MTSPLHHQSRPLLTGLAQAGVDLGTEVLDARREQQEALRFLDPYQAAVNVAVQALRERGEFKKRSATLVEATAELQAAQAANSVVQDLAESNLIAAINVSTASYDEQLLTMFNGVVDEFKLNEHAPALPNFTSDGMRLDMLSLSAAQASAVLTWKTAAERLHPLWDGFVRLAKYQGHTLGPVGMDSVWTNRLTAACLGANTSAETMTSATVFVAWDSATESSRQIRQLLPFVVSAIAGFDLQLRAVSDANGILRGMGNVMAPGGIPVGVG